MSSSHGNWKDLLKACEEGNEGLIRYYMDHGGVDPNYQHPEFFTAPLMEAIRNGRRGAVQLLLTYPQTNVRLVEDSSDLLPVQIAMQQQQHAIVDMLLPRLVEEEDEATLESLCPTILVSMEEMDAPPPPPQQQRRKGTNRNNNRLRDAVVEKLLDCGYRVILVVADNNDDDMLESSMKQKTGNHKIHTVAASSFFTKEKETIREITQRDAPVSLWIRCASLTHNNNNNNNANKNTLGTDSSTTTTTRIAQQHLVLMNDDLHNAATLTPSSSLTFLFLGRVTLWDRLVFWSDWDDRRIRATVWLAKQCLENKDHQEEQGRVLYDCHCANDTQPSLSNLTF